jgi:hypothetical protein
VASYTIRGAYLLLLTFFFSCGTFVLYSQESEEDYFDELSVFVTIPRVGSIEVPAAIKNNEAYLSITDLFNYLKIKVEYTSGFDEVSGFLVSPDAQYKILRPQNKIIYSKKEYQLMPGDFIRTESALYLRSKVFGDVFGLDLSFNFRALAVNLNTQIELPIIREMRLEQMRQNIKEITGDITPDTTFRQRRSFFHAGNLDWNVNSMQQIGGDVNTRLNMGLGTQLFGGEANFIINIDTDNPFDLRQQSYIWKYANNDNKVVRQLSLGRVSSSGKIGINAPLTGLHITNAPTTYRRSFGTYILSDITEPGWMVELYVNNILVNYMQADASGFFSFEVPLVYGETNVKLQFYGPYGEERSMEKVLSIPFNFLPKGTFEYNLTAAVTEDSSMARYVRADFNYGFGRSLSAGGGVEYFSAVQGNKFMPYIRSSLKILPDMLLNAEYMHGVKFESLLSYRVAKNLNIELNYLKFAKDQKAYPTSSLEERRISLALPIRGKSFSMFARLSAMQLILPQVNTFATEMVLSAGFKSFTANLTTQARFFPNSNPFVYSSLSMAFRLPAGFIITPQTLFNFTSGTFANARLSVDKQFSRMGYATLSYEQNFASKMSSIDLGIRFELSFARFSINARKSGKSYTFSESASGGIIFDAKSDYLAFRNRGSVGRGGVVIIPYLDVNCNGIMDEGEIAISGINANVNGGIVKKNEKSSTISVTDLEPYTSYMITVNASSTENISWQLPFKNIEVVAEPNKMKRVEIPVFPLGEVSGMVFIKQGDRQERGLGRMIVDVYSDTGTKVKSLLSEPDGYYSYLGLKPGKYYVSIDSVQLSKLNMTVSDMIFPFTIHPSYDGDMIGGLDFTVFKGEEDTLEEQVIQERQPAQIIQVAPVEVDNSSYNTVYRVQVYALTTKIRDEKLLAKIERFVPGLKLVEIKGDDGFYKYVSEPILELERAKKIIYYLKRIGYKDSFIKIEK